MKHIVSNRQHLDNIVNEINREIEHGVTLNVWYEKASKSKTKKQLGYIFGGLIKALQGWQLDISGEKIPLDSIKSMLYSKLLTPEIKCVCGIMSPVYTTLSKMNIDQTSLFIDNVIGFCDNLPDFIMPIELRYTWIVNVSPEELAIIKRETLAEKQPEYLSYLRNQNCLRCGVMAECAHHIRQGNYSGMGKKSPDWLAIPLCNRCHHDLHNTIGESEFLSHIDNVLNGFEIESFCRIVFYRWYRKGLK